MFYKFTKMSKLPSLRLKTKTIKFNYATPEQWAANSKPITIVINKVLSNTAYSHCLITVTE